MSNTEFTGSSNFIFIYATMDTITFEDWSLNNVTVQDRYKLVNVHSYTSCENFTITNFESYDSKFYEGIRFDFGGPITNTLLFN